MIKNASEVGISIFDRYAPRQPVSAGRVGLVDGVVLWKLDGRDASTLAAGFLARLCRHLPPVVPDMSLRLREFSYHRMRERWKPLALDTDLSVETYLAKTSYSSSYKSKILGLWNDIADLRIDPKFLQDLLRCGIFGKDEFYLEPKFARLISARHELLLAILGPIVKAVEEEIFKHPMFIKKVPCKDRPVYMQNQLESGSPPAVFEGDDGLGKHNGKVVASDWTSFEVAFRLCASLLTADLFHYMLANFLVEFRRLSDACWSGSWGRAALLMSCFIAIIRNSGDLITSLGNGHYNSSVWDFLHLEHPSRDLTKDDFAALGGICKLDVVATVGEASFCGMIYDESCLEMVRDAVPVLAKIGWTPCRYVNTSERVHLQLFKLRLISLGYEMGHCPILWKYASVFLGQLTSVVIRRSILENMDEYARELALKALSCYDNGEFPDGIIAEPLAGTRELYARAYGVTVQQQLEVETYIERCDFKQQLNFPHLVFPKVWRDIHDEYVLGYNHRVEIWPQARPPIKTTRLRRGVATSLH